MSQTINRMYSTVDNAHAAVAELESYGYDDIFVVTPPAEGETADLDAITASIMKSNVLKSLAKIYAVGVSNGGTLVTVHALFGTALGAIGILDSHHPIASGYVEPTEPSYAWDEAMPLSCMMGLPVLSNNPTPISTTIGLPPLASSKTTLSGLFGLKLLTSGPASLSAMFGLPTLTRHSAGLSQTLGLPLLSSTRPQK